MYVKKVGIKNVQKNEGLVNRTQAELKLVM